MSKAFRRLLAAVAAFALSGGQAMAQRMDPANPTCPPNPNWSNNPRMEFTVAERGGQRVLLAEGRIDDTTPERLQEALDADETIQEIWLRSPGGDARAGTDAGQIIRQTGVVTRIPPGWACYSACNFMFVGGPVRFVDQGGLFIVHMFTFTGNREAIQNQIRRGTDQAISTIRQIEQDAAQLAAGDAEFLVRMGIYPRFLPEVLYQASASQRRCLTQQEIAQYSIVPPVAPEARQAVAPAPTPSRQQRQPQRQAPVSDQPDAQPVDGAPK